MKLMPLLEDAVIDKRSILKLQQQLLDELPDDTIDVSIERAAGNLGRLQDEWRLRCSAPGYKRTVALDVRTPINPSVCCYVVAMLLKEKIEAYRFDNRTNGRYFLSRHGKRDYTGILHVSTAPVASYVPFRIIARFNGQESSGSGVYAIAHVHTLAALDRAMEYVDSAPLVLTDGTPIDFK